MSKNPYEIRLELLHIARDFIIEQNMNERIRLENDWNIKCEAVRHAHDKGQSAEFPSFPKVPDIDENAIIKMAEKLNGFVSKSD